MSTTESDSDNISEGVPSIDIKEFLECPVCKCFVASPINTCPNGHVVCGICKPKIIKCPTCNVDNLAVNGLVERILKNKGVETTCRNDEEGCTRRIKVWEMKEHLDDFCDFRPIKCAEKNKEGVKCDRRSYSPKDLFQHWINVHKVESIIALPSMDKKASESTELEMPPKKRRKRLLVVPSEVLYLLGAVTVRFGLSARRYRKSCISEGRTIWRVKYFELEGRTFIIHTELIGENLYFWITLLGEETEANKHKYTATIRRRKFTSHPQRKITFHGIPMHSLQYHNLEKVKELGDTVTVSAQNLKMLQDKSVHPDKELRWEVHIELSKVLNS